MKFTDIEKMSPEERKAQPVVVRIEFNKWKKEQLDQAVVSKTDELAQLKEAVVSLDERIVQKKEAVVSLDKKLDDMDKKLRNSPEAQLVQSYIEKASQ
jgi:predicted  nucleic acid-binding Zn-ribbon protein